MPERITETAYDPPVVVMDALQGERMEVEYDDEREFQVGGNPATQIDLRVIDTLRDVEISLTETTSVVGHLASAQGDIGLAAVYHCSLARNLGEPTLIYTDERITLGDLDERYHDLSAEWYRPNAVEAGVVDARKNQHADSYDAVSMTLDELESLAMRYLEADDNE